jgi:hypothetical protein
MCLPLKLASLFVFRYCISIYCRWKCEPTSACVENNNHCRHCLELGDYTGDMVTGKKMFQTLNSILFWFEKELVHFKPLEDYHLIIGVVCSIINSEDWISIKQIYFQFTSRHTNTFPINAEGQTLRRNFCTLNNVYLYSDIHINVLT